MTKNTQEYINNLLNKHKTFYLDLSNSTKTSTCSHCNKKSWEENTPNLSGEIENLSEFQNLRGINASNNQFTNLGGLFTLPNKNKVEKINLFGNKISEVDLARIFTEFPNLKYLNLDRNPLSLRNLSNLTDKQLEKLSDGLKSKQIRISLGQGSVLADLLEYTQKLIKKGNSSSAHKLQAIIQGSSVKSSEQESNNKTGYKPLD
ncbi:MAG: hypothetical protein I3274_05665 [Candidatus Moeniiplasma glomeromycotorum]|nr:hypothetical protein [Candidatus Moeniiplasma glomeromycotorum]